MCFKRIVQSFKATNNLPGGFVPRSFNIYPFGLALYEAELMRKARRGVAQAELRGRRIHAGENGRCGPKKPTRRSWESYTLAPLGAGLDFHQRLLEIEGTYASTKTECMLIWDVRDSPNAIQCDKQPRKDIIWEYYKERETSDKNIKMSPLCLFREELLPDSQKKKGTSIDTRSVQI